MPRNKQYRIAQEKRTKERSKTARPLNEEAVNSVLDKDNDTKTQKQKRTRRFCLTTYIDVLALDSFLKRSPWVQHYAYCTHDRDYNEDGTPKMLHTHVLLYTYDAKTSSAIKKIFDNYSAEYYKKIGLDPQNTCTQECHDMGAQFRYLRHLDNPNKQPYNADEVYTDDIVYWNELCRTAGMTDSSTNTGLAMLNDYLSGMSSYEMVERYGKEYMYHAKQIREMALAVLSETQKETFGGLLQMCEFALGDSSYTQAQLVLFYQMLSYVQAKFKQAQNNGEVGYYLKA